MVDGSSLLLSTGNCVRSILLCNTCDGDAPIIQQVTWMDTEYSTKHEYRMRHKMGNQSPIDICHIVHPTVDLLNTWAVVPTISEPTREANCLDNICTDLEESRYNSKVINGNISDHLGQIINIKYNEGEQMPTKISYTFRQVNKDSRLHVFLELLGNENWSEVYDTPGDVS
ncbi:unnamed protein product, partial [Callosobruchus maculatus]